MLTQIDERVRKLSKNRGFTLLEIVLVLAVFSIISFIIVRLYVQTQTTTRKSQQLTNLQQLAQESLDEISRELRQIINVRTTEIGDIYRDSNFSLASDGSNQLCIFVTKRSNPDDKQIADRIIYRRTNYNGKPNRLVQQLTTFKRDVNGDVVEDISYPEIPIINDMDEYRSNPGGIPGGQLIGLFNNFYYSYDNITFYWDYDSNSDNSRGVMALGLTVSLRDERGKLQNRLTLNRVINLCPITGITK